MSILRDLRALPPIQIIGAGTHTIPVPTKCVSWEVWLFGGGGSGGVARGTAAKATGGAGGCYGHIKRPLLSGVSSLTAVLGLQGNGVEISSDTTSSGNSAQNSTLTDGSVILTVPGGGGGNAAVSPVTSVPAALVGSAPTVSDGGDIETALGGASGAVSGVSTDHRTVTGGGGPGGPWGNGASSGVISGNWNGATGGASAFFPSGSVTGELSVPAVTGGGGQGGKSGDNDGSAAGTGGGGAWGPSQDNTANGYGAGMPHTNSSFNRLSGADQVTGLNPVSGLYFTLKGHCQGNIGGPTFYTTAGPGGGGGGMYYVGSGNIRHGGMGGWFGGGGGYYINGSQAILSPHGGFMGGGGGLCVNVQSGAGGDGGVSAGGGGTSGISTGIISSGNGGSPYIAVIFYVSD